MPDVQVGSAAEFEEAGKKALLGFNLFGWGEFMTLFRGERIYANTSHVNFMVAGAKLTCVISGAANLSVPD